MTKAHFKEITQRDNYFWLLLALLVLFFASALAAQMEMRLLARLTAVSLTGIILVAVWSVEKHRFPFSSRVGVTIVFVLLEGSEFFLEIYHLGTLQMISLLLFTVGTIVLSSRQVLMTGSVDANKIVGSICIFLLMGIAWAEAYLLVERFFPGSIPALSGDSWRAHLEGALYFSYVSLTTLGYGDISPAQPLARYLAYMEAVTGQFYVAIVIASLIGGSVSGATRQE
jgi:voltage-gated potassium channel